MRLKSTWIAIIFGVSLFALIGLSQLNGLFITESTKVPATISEGDFAGQYDPADIRGSYSFKDIELNFGVDVVVLAEAFGVSSENPGDFLCKELEALYPASEEQPEIGTDSVRLFVALITGLPIQSDSALPENAVGVLIREGIWTNALELQMEGRIVKLDAIVETSTELSGIQENETPDVIEHEETFGVKGKTTVSEVMDWGVELEEIESILGVPVSNINMTIRDICTNESIEFSTVKETLNTLLEQ